MRHVTPINASCQTYMYESGHTCEWVMFHI